MREHKIQIQITQTKRKNERQNKLKIKEDKKSDYCFYQCLYIQKLKIRVNKDNCKVKSTNLQINSEFPIFIVPCLLHGKFNYLKSTYFTRLWSKAANISQYYDCYCYYSTAHNDLQWSSTDIRTLGRKIGKLIVIKML